MSTIRFPLRFRVYQRKILRCEIRTKKYKKPALWDIKQVIRIPRLWMKLSEKGKESREESEEIEKGEKDVPRGN